ncbi:MAG TPA: hypothetical protein VHV51_24385 [Polyangiaceae bacterium]|jgi:hypothetical protein|nr:hypothetical protein [Polyangiaceae bacterium]
MLAKIATRSLPLVLLACSAPMLLVGCGTTGLDWVDQPETATGWSGSEERSVANVPVQRADESIPASADGEPAQENHQRLNHTVTLGAVDAPPPDAQAAYGYGPPPVSVTINNYGQVGGSGPGYAGYYYGGVIGRGGAGRSSGVTGASRGSSARGGGMQPGQNWPSIGDHGTAFPYHTAPASPWTGAGRSQ